MIIIYARVSPTTGRANEGASLRTQVDDLVAHVNKSGRAENYIIVSCGPDPCVGGKNFPAESGGAPMSERPGLMHALGLCEKGDTLLCLKVDRLARSTLTHALVRHELDRIEAKLEFVQDGGGVDGPEANLLRGILSVFAEFERDRIAIRTLRGKRESMANGGWWGGKIPFGMRLVDGGGLEVDMARLDDISLALDMLYAGAPWKEIQECCHMSSSTLAKVAKRKLHPHVLAALDSRGNVDIA